jgi:hypothetical protein
VRDVIPPHCRKDKYDKVIQQLEQSGQVFADPEHSPTDETIKSVQTANMKYISWYRIHDFYGDRDYAIFQKFKIKDQVMRNMGYSYIIDALNTLSSQPGLVVRLFESTQKNPQGFYQIWMNVCGEWKETLIDDIFLFSVARKNLRLNFTSRIHPVIHKIEKFGIC